ncbi:MAG: hypothetical protein IBX43_03170 [Campylobacterales bacterium]|nr:hypothetical protein [Campylobacterales bacterium]
MFFWSSLFGSDAASEHFHFGRFISYKKSSLQQAQYQESKKAFSEQRCIEGYEHYFNYLCFYDAAQECTNISYSKDENTLNFKLIQGSAIIQGSITQRRMSAHVNIALMPKENISVMRRLLEKNFLYTYSSFFLDEDTLKVKICFDNISLSPQKVFFPLRELAINADREKELILDEFNDLEPLELDHIEVMDTHLKETKLRFFREWIDKTEQKVLLLPTQEQSGAIAFVWINLLFKIDYFVTPRGKLGYDIYEALQAYYLDDGKHIEEKNDALQKAVEKLKELDTSRLSKNLYCVKETFDIFNSEGLEEVHAFIEETLAKAVWYKEHRYEEIILPIYEYLGQYMLYNYGMNPCLRELVQLNVRLHNTDFYSALGIESLYKNDKLRSKKISSLIRQSIHAYNEQYPYLHDFSPELNFSTNEKFHHSFFLALKNLNFSEL